MSRIWKDEETIFVFNKIILRKNIESELENITKECNELYDRKDKDKSIRTKNSIIYRLVLLYCIESDGEYEKGKVSTELMHLKKLIDNNKEYDKPKKKVLKDYENQKYKDIKILYNKIRDEIIKDEYNFYKIKDIVYNKNDNNKKININNDHIKDITNEELLKLFTKLNERFDKLEKDNKMILKKLEKMQK